MEKWAQVYLQSPWEAALHPSSSSREQVPSDWQTAQALPATRESTHLRSWKSITTGQKCNAQQRIGRLLIKISLLSSLSPLPPLPHTIPPHLHPPATASQLFQWLLGCCAISTQNLNSSSHSANSSWPQIHVTTALMPFRDQREDSVMYFLKEKHLFSALSSSGWRRTLSLKVFLFLIALSILQQFLSFQEPQCG